MIYFITVNYYASNLIAQLISSIPKDTRIPYQFIIVNNSPDDAGLAQLNQDNVVIIESKSNLGFGQACNLGINWVYSQNPQAILWLINPDTYFKQIESPIEKAYDFFTTHTEVSILGTTIYTTSGKIWFAGGRFIRTTGEIVAEKRLFKKRHIPYIRSDWISGCSLIINLRNFTDCPQFDPAYFLYYEDFDFCMRYANEGHLIAVTEQLYLIHRPSSITNKNTFNKLKYSTCSYLITLEKYANNLVALLRFCRIILYIPILLPVKPQVALGKIYGILLYLQYRI